MTTWWETVASWLGAWAPEYFRSPAFGGTAMVFAAIVVCTSVQRSAQRASWAEHHREALEPLA